MAKPKSFVFDLAGTCICQACIEKIEKCVAQIDGVDSVIPIDATTKKLTISGTVKPEVVIGVLRKKYKKQVKLVPEDILPQRNGDSRQIIRNDDRQVVQNDNRTFVYIDNRQFIYNDNRQFVLSDNRQINPGEGQGRLSGGHGVGTSSGGRRPHGNEIVPRRR